MAEELKKADEKHRPSAGDYIGRPMGNGGGNNLAPPLLQVTRDRQNWIPQSYFSDAEIGMAKRFLGKQMARHGRVNLEQLILQAGQLNRARDGLSTNQYIQVATGEQRRLALLGQSWFNRMDQSAQMAPTDGAK